MQDYIIDTDATITFAVEYGGKKILEEEYVPDAQNQTSLQRSTVDTYELLDGRDMERDFQLNTPWLVNASLGYTVGNSLALGAEYEFENYGSMKFSYPEGGEMPDVIMEHRLIERKSTAFRTR